MIGVVLPLLGQQETYFQDDFDYSSTMLKSYYNNIPRATLKFQIMKIYYELNS